MNWTDRLAELEKESRLLEPSPEKRAAWDQAVWDYAHTFIDEIENEKAFHNDRGTTGPEWAPVFSEEPESIEDVLAFFKKEMDNYGLNPASGGHIAYIPGGGIYPTALGDYLAAITNKYAGIFYAGPGAVRMENQLIRWMCDVVGYPEGSLGNLGSGGSIANLIAITTARDHLDIKARDVERAVIYLTRQVHHCVNKAIRIAGLGEALIRYVPMDERFRMDADALQKQVGMDQQNGLKPFLIVGSAGTTDTGAIDPLDRLADIAESANCWFHVDAAYGGFFVLLDSLKDAFKGMERSDSIAIDPHKGLFLAYGLGAVLIKNVEALYNSHYYRANYFQDVESATEEPSPADLSPELTKHFRGLRMWLALKLFGLRPFRACLEEKRLLTLYFYEKVQELGFELGPEPELSVMTYRYIPEEGDPNLFNTRLMKQLHDDGRIFVSSTSIDGVFWIRLAVLSFRTHRREIDLLLEMLKEGVEQVKGQIFNA